MNVLSLCDGMSCGRIALEKAGFKVDEYYAAEIKDIAIKVTKENYPDTIHIGDLTKVSYKDGILKTENGIYITDIDLVIFGSPCQSFSIAMKIDKRIGLEDMKKSGLFLECYRILKEVDPKYFLMENVASMKADDRDFISDMMGVLPIRINSSVVGPMLRDRYYWTNIPCEPIDRVDINFQEILEDGYTNRDKARSLLVSDSRPLRRYVKMFHRYYSSGFTTLIFKSKEHYIECLHEYKRLLDEHGGKLRAVDLDDYDGHVFDGVRYMTQGEMEACQTVPKGYTSCLTRDEAADVLGDGWTIDVIVHLFKGMDTPHVI